MKAFLLIILFSGLMLVSKAQMFDRYIGIRMGYANGLFYETQINDMDSYRFMYSSRNKGMHFTAMKITRKYKTEQLPEEFSLYYGYGGHIGYVKWNKAVTNKEIGYYWDQRSAAVFGLDAIVGISYDFKRQPISVTFDVKPFFDLLGPDGFNAMPYDFAFGAIYCF
ncbi:MAG: hypothetical protein JW735_04595 [Prolixibacteraceae bacterium]|nr:hypothetical protein [Prolixibacteraceae bacterium]